MADPLYERLKAYLPADSGNAPSVEQSRYISRLLSLRVSDLSTTEPESLQQSTNSNNATLQALSSRSYRTTTASFDHLSTLGAGLSDVRTSVADIRRVVPQLDVAAVQFASSYSKLSDTNHALENRKKSMLLARQANKVQDIVELPALLTAAIAAASNTTSGGSNYSQALDLFAHIKRLNLLYPDSTLVQKALQDAKVAMKDMITNLITALRSQNIRLAASIRTVGWLRRVLPELGNIEPSVTHPATTAKPPGAPSQQNDDDFGAIFLCARLSTFLAMTEALSPLRDLADQETERRMSQSQMSGQSAPARRSSHQGYATQGQQTERYLKRYIEVFREQSFSTMSMFKNIFPAPENQEKEELLQLPSPLASFPLHMVTIFTDTLRAYLPNIVDSATRESLMMQVLYAANSLGRLGADFSIMIESLVPGPPATTDGEDQEPEWVRVIQKHRVQSARLDALAAGQDRAGSGSPNSSIPVQ
jgi:conserved oligomeric Golgi complex subunit 8